MERINLNEGWKEFAGIPANFLLVPENAVSVTFPRDSMILQDRDRTAVGGSFNSYFNSCVICFYREMPVIAAAAKVFLEIDGLLGSADIYIGGRFVVSVSDRSKKTVDITRFSVHGAMLCIRIASHPDGGKYIGCGIAGGVSLLLQHDPFSVVPYGVRIQTVSVSADKAHLSAFIEMQNDTSKVDVREITVEIFNQKNRRLAKKIKNIKLAAGGRKIFEVPLKISNPFEWTLDDPYLYRAAVSAGADCQALSFGVVRHELKDKRYLLNGKVFKIKGAVMPHDGGIVGAASLPPLEYRKFSALKEIGYNAVRYTELPTETVLQTLDRLGMLCVVDIFSSLSCPGVNAGGNPAFTGKWELTVDSAVRSLRVHPCVAVIGIADDAAESYGRGEGYGLVHKIAEKIRLLAPAALIAANAFERAPDRLEAERFDLKLKAPFADRQAIAAAREKDVFGKLTEPYFDCVDIAGYSGLFPRFSSDKKRTILGMADPGEKAQQVFEEVDKNPHVAGCFLEYGVDFYGGLTEDSNGLCVKRGGDLDLTGRRKSGSYYKGILLGKKGVCSITVQDPDAVGVDSPDDSSDCHALWNWPRHVGKPVKIVVHTSGDIVALTLDGKSVGRKLAGKLNNYTAVFKTSFCPGRLEAVSYYKGVEHGRCVLETVSAQPKAIKLECPQKNVALGECAVVDITLVDKEGRTVPFASRRIEVSVAPEEGEVVAAGNANPYGEKSREPGVVAAYDGRAVAIVRCTHSGKTIVKVSGENLSANKITLKVK